MWWRGLGARGRFTFAVGTYGMDDRSNLRLVMRGVCDWGAPDFTDPTAPNYCKVFTNGNAKLRVHFDRENHVRPLAAHHPRARARRHP